MNDQTNYSETQASDTENLHKALSKLTEEVRNQCCFITDFDLPQELHSERTSNTDSTLNRKQTNKQRRKASYRARTSKDAEKIPQNSETQASDTENLHKALSKLTEEVRNQCCFITDFDLPQELHSERTSNIDSTVNRKQTNKRRRKASYRARKSKDTERKRQKRTWTSALCTSETLPSTQCLSQTLKDDESPWKKLYRENADYRNRKKDYSKAKYTTDVNLQKAKKDYSKKKYSTDYNFQNQKKQASRDKYANDKHFRDIVKLFSKKKYANDQHFRDKVKLKIRLLNKKKYAFDRDFRDKAKLLSRKKYALDQNFRDKAKLLSRKKYALDQNFRDKAKLLSRKKYATDPDFRDKLKQLNLLHYRHNVLIRENCKRRLRELYKRNQEIRQRKILLAQQRRRTERNRLNRDANWFKMQVREGPRYVCSVCHKFKFRKQVVECDKEKYSEKSEKSQAIAGRCISEKFKSECTNACEDMCKLINHQLWLCYTCHRHILKGELPIDAYSNGLQLHPIPDELKCLNRLERQLISKRIPFMKLVQLPKGNQRGVIGPCVSVPTDIQKTTQVLPRCDDETQLVRCKLKRKLTYKGHSQYEFVSTKRVCTALEFLKQHNQLYHETEMNPAWEHGIDDIAEADTDQPEIQTEQVNDEDGEEEDQNTKDRGLPADTCLQPVDIGQEMLDQHFDDIFCVAPGEGKTPVSMMQEKGNEAMSFPVQFPAGSEGTYDSNRQARLTRSRYFHARLLNADRRFSSDSSYIFYAQYLSELEQVMSKVSIALRKSSGKDTTGNAITAQMITNRDQLNNLLSTDQGYKFLTPIRGTPPYWQAAMRDLMAMIRQLGIPTWFATFSAADLRWSEVLEVLLEQQESQQSVEDLDWTGKAELLRDNPVMNAIMFNHRFQTFLKEIIIKKGVIGQVKDHFHRIEFQQRGSPHAHCLFWIQDAPQIDKDEDQTVCEFIDRYVSCELPDKTTDPDLYEIVNSVQQHSKNHSKSCRKKGTTCRFNFPRPPSERTFISRTSQSLTDPSIELSPKQMIANAKVTLQRLQHVLENGNVENITTQNLFAAAGITQQEFEDASNILTKKTNIILKRKPADIWVNQFHPHLLRCWNANMDLQFITDPYSCVMYIISYISKAEREMGVVLENARKEAAEGNCNAQEAMKKIGSAYFRQREVSAQEAAYRVCGLHLKESSRKVQFVPCGDNQIRMSLPLNIIKMKAGETDEENIWMHSLYDRYKARPESEVFENLCYASFCSEFCILSPSQVPKNAAQSNVFQLQDGLGFIRRRTRTDNAVVRYPRFSEKKNPEQHYQSLLQLFMPHRADDQLKPPVYNTYKEMYMNGGVVIKPVTEVQSVRDIVTANKQKFEVNAEALDEAENLIETHGPLEDAWAMIAPETEAERIECETERIRLDEDDAHDVAIPELDSSNRKVTHGNDIEIRQNRYNSQQMQAMMRGLNAKQKDILYKVRQWCLDKANGLNPAPFRIFVNGGAGTGKSHLIKCLHYETTRILSPTANSPDDILVLLTAPTATAAFNIGGATLHQTFSLSKTLPLPYIYKRDDELNKLRTKLQYLNILIIDEISMVGQRLLIYISERLRQIKQSGNALFGNTCVIAVGDFYQLPPVKQKTLFDLRPENYFPLWASNFSITTLDQIMRQKDDALFAQLLNRLRVKKRKERLLESDRAILEKCTQHSEPLETLHIYGTNKEVSSHNNDMANKVCEIIETIAAQDFDKDAQTGRLKQRQEPYSNTSHDYLTPYLLIGPKARVMLIRNIDVGVGLVNGAMGTVTEILPPEHGSAFPKGIMVLFDNEKVGAQNNPSRGIQHQAIKISTYEENLNNNAARRQFPLQLAWACTVHKVQGVTTDKVVVSLRNIFAPGMSYVALSRVTSMEGLVIKDFEESKIYCNEQISEALSRMPLYLPPSDNDNTVCHNNYVIILHNIQGLIPHINDLQSNSDTFDANLICLTETWLERNSIVPSLDGYQLIYKQRCSAYPTQKDLFQRLRNQKHGGVGIFARNSNKCYELVMDSINMECVATYVKDINTNVVLIYRPETYTTSTFIDELYQVVMGLPLENYDTSTIILGDFNEDLLKPNSPIKKFMDQQGFKQIVSKATTDGNTLIDHVYINGNLKVSVDHAQTYYSYHNMVAVKIEL